MNVVTGKCVNCGKEDEIHAHGKCYHCYRQSYKQPTIACKKCGQTVQHHSRGMCHNCVQMKFYYERIKGFNVKKYHNIDYPTWKELTKKCILCGFDKVVDLHHLDKCRENSSKENLVGLCPNHHRMIHDIRYSDETQEEIRKKLEPKA